MRWMEEISMIENKGFYWIMHSWWNFWIYEFDSNLDELIPTCCYASELVVLQYVWISRTHHEIRASKKGEKYRLYFTNAVLMANTYGIDELESSIDA